MSRLAFLLGFVSLTSFAHGAEWAYSDDRQASATIVAGVGAASDTFAAFAMGDNGAGESVATCTNGDFQKVLVPSGMLLDAAVGPSGTNVMAAGGWNILLSTDTGATYNTLEVGVKGTSQSVNVAGDDFALVGGFLDTSTGAQTNGVLKISEAGELVGTYDIGVPEHYLARYGAFPSENVWYVTSGMWGDTHGNVTVAEENSKLRRGRGGVRHLSSHVTLDSDGRPRYDPHPGPLKKTTATDSESGWYMAISKTEDGGATFTTVYTSPSDTYYYPNGISCSDELHCVAVAEGYLADGTPSVWAFVTFDGGATWQDTMTKGEGEMGLMAAKFLNAEVGWLGGFGTSEGSRGYYGHFWSTTDGGKSWELNDMLENCMVLDMDFGPTVGYAACVPPMGGNCNAALYQ